MTLTQGDWSQKLTHLLGAVKAVPDTCSAYKPYGQACTQPGRPRVSEEGSYTSSKLYVKIFAFGQLYVIKISTALPVDCFVPREERLGVPQSRTHFLRGHNIYN